MQTLPTSSKLTRPVAHTIYVRGHVAERVRLCLHSLVPAYIHAPAHRLSAGAGRHVSRGLLGHDWRDVLRGDDCSEDVRV